MTSARDRVEGWRIPPYLGGALDRNRVAHWLEYALAVLREAFQPKPALDGLEKGFDAPPPLSYPRQILTAQIEV